MKGELVATLWSTRQTVRVRWAHGLISALDPVATVLDQRIWVGPALVDLQINGFAGVDFQQDNLTELDLLRAVAGLRAAGCGRFLLTLMTDQWPRMIERLRHLRRLRDQSATLRQTIAGWHLEGPFLSSEPGYCGAHDPGCMIDPTLAHIQELWTVTLGDSILLTIAPERAGAIEAIAAAAALGVRISLGHTNASADQLRQAVAAGATGFTHLGNACPQQLDRHDNIIWRALDTPGLTVSLIPDKIHVSPGLFRMVHRVLGDEWIYYTTDAISAAGAPPGRYSVGQFEVVVGPDRIVRQPGKSNYAGSALRPIDGVFCSAAMINRPWQDVWGALSVRPARFMGWASDLEVGAPANFCMLQLDDNGAPAELRTVMDGADLESRSQ